MTANDDTPAAPPPRDSAEYARMLEELKQCFALYDDLARRYVPALRAYPQLLEAAHGLYRLYGTLTSDPELILNAAWQLLELYGTLAGATEDSPHPHLSLDQGIGWVAMPWGVGLRYNAIGHDGEEPLDLRIAASKQGLYLELLAPETDSTLATALLGRDALRALPVPLSGASPVPADTPMGLLSELYDHCWLDYDPSTEPTLAAVIARARALVEAERGANNQTAPGQAR